MKVLVMGATGYLGSVVAETLMARGHSVTAMVRSARILPPGVAQRVADLADADSVRAAVEADTDAVVHAATPLGDWDLERRSVQAALRALASPHKRFVYISGVWVLGSSTLPDGSTRILDETAPADPIALVAGREALEADVLSSPLTGIVVRPGILHGRNGGIPALMRSWATQEGRGVFVGEDERVTWASVHVEDAAALVSLALEQGSPGQVLHAVAEPAVPSAQVAAAAATAVGAGARPPRRRGTGDAAGDLGVAFAEALALPQVVESLVAPKLGWRPTRPGILDDVRSGSFVGSH